MGCIRVQTYQHLGGLEISFQFLHITSYLPSTVLVLVDGPYGGDITQYPLTFYWINL